MADGPNIEYEHPGGEVTFYYDHGRHYVWNTSEGGPVITAPGSHQKALGCESDWAPDCLNPWLVDPDGDGVYTWVSRQIPQGNYEMKVAHNLSWDENYGADGEAGGANVSFSVPRDGVTVTMKYTLATHEIVVETSEAGNAMDLTSAKGHWLTPELIAWPNGEGLDKLTWQLHAAADGGLQIEGADVSGGDSFDLTVDPAGLPDDLRKQYPHLANYAVLRLSSEDAAKAADLLRGQVAVTGAADGKLSDASGLQIPGVLDSLYAEAMRDVDLGVSWNANTPTLRLWAPTAQQVELTLVDGEDTQTKEMTRDDSGTWSVTGDPSWKGLKYTYAVDVYVPSTGQVERNSVTDPYSVGLSLNSTHSVLVNLDDADLKPEGWADSTGPVLASPVDQTIYELHVRDFSLNDPEVPEELRGSYLAFAEDSHGTRHLRELAKAGLNTVHLLPTFDIASIEEDKAKQTTPECDLEAGGPASEDQQACVAAQADTDAFNWGYDPFHFLVPEGSYASNAEAAFGGSRTAEFRTMVKALHDMDLRVVLDQVYNHTAASGQADQSVLDQVVPGYYHRLNAQGEVEQSTCCENIATEHAMAEKLMVDSIVTWARDYRVDGFRFDLMGHHSRWLCGAAQRIGELRRCPRQRNAVGHHIVQDPRQPGLERG